jgi:hypothetical protein
MVSQTSNCLLSRLNCLTHGITQQDLCTCRPKLQRRQSVRVSSCCIHSLDTHSHISADCSILQHHHSSEYGMERSCSNASDHSTLFCCCESVHATANVFQVPYTVIISFVTFFRPSYHSSLRTFLIGRSNVPYSSLSKHRSLSLAY